MAKKKAKSNGAAKKSNGTRSEGVERRRFTEKLPVAIDEATCAEKGRELASVIHKRQEFLDEQAERNREARAKVASFNERLEELANSVEEHAELRDVECVDKLFVETAEVKTFRLDTGAQVGEARPADAEDRQEVLGLDAKGRKVPNDLWATAPGGVAHHFAAGHTASACGLPYTGAPVFTPAAPDAPTCEECSAKRSSVGAAVAKKGTAAARKKRGGKTTVVSADAGAE